MLSAWFDVSAGCAGDMICGALIDAGAPLDQVQRCVDAVIPDSVRLHAETVNRAGLRAINLTVEVLAADRPHRSWTTIRGLLADADLPAPVRAAATAVFGRLAEAEGRVHAIAPEQVHFHEVGSLDSIADIVGSCAALHLLGIQTMSAGSMALGSGTVSGAHGRLPVPVPAVLELVRGWEVISGGKGELTTPTGAAIVTALAATCSPLPAMTVHAVGVGAGDRDTPGRANVVRVVIGAASTTGPTARPDALVTSASAAVLLQTNIDDLDPRVWPGVLTRLLATGADDAWLTPILMKKGRPAHTLSVLASAESMPALRDVVLRETSTIGVRETPVTKHALDRAWVPVTVTGGTVRVKIALSDGVIVQATAEFEDAAALAASSGRPVREILDEAATAALAAGLIPGRPFQQG